MTSKPNLKPNNNQFSSGPCTKRKGWTTQALSNALVGRSHRAPEGLTRIREVVSLTREVLEIPEDYRVAIVPASDTGAVEMVMWSVLGARGLDILAWESFGKGWVTDVVTELKLEDTRKMIADYGKLPDLNQVDTDRDVVFCWNGTTSGVRVPNGDWIKGDRKGITICDATSAAFAMDLPWKKLDVVTFSWQKVLGGEAQHGILVLSPRAVERIESYSPPWPMPKIFRMKKKGKFNEALFNGSVINTPSLLCVEDVRDALVWAKSIGGSKGIIEKSEANLKVLEDWIKVSPDFDFLAEDPTTRSCTSVCFKIVDSWFLGLEKDIQKGITSRIVTLLEEEEVALDIASYRDAPAGFRVWCGATVEKEDLVALTPWFDWAYDKVKTELS